jgi:hypothetical protein
MRQRKPLFDSSPTPLENVALTGLECANTRVSDLTPLRDMRLELLRRCAAASPTVGRKAPLIKRRFFAGLKRVKISEKSGNTVRGFAQKNRITR